MRKIKFRGRDIENNKFIFSKSIEFEKISGLNGYQPYLCNDNGEWTRCYPESVAQFVGYDKNGAEIYSDDEVRVKDWKRYCMAGTGIEYAAEFFTFADIGKTFDNVELLKENDYEKN